MTGDPIRLSGTNLERAADHNQRVTLHAIRVKGPITRVDLAELTGLTAASIANITKRLAIDGLISEAGQRRGGRGQPATRLVVNPEACFAIGVNIDRDHVTVVLVNFTGEVIGCAARLIDFPSPEDVQAHFRDAMPRLVADAGIDPARLVGIGVAMPDDFGLIDLPGRPADFARWETTDLAALLTSPPLANPTPAVPTLPVFVENDAAAAAMGEQQFGHGQTAASFFYILIASGLGGGLAIDGNYWRGAQGRSGEIGFLPLGDQGGQIQQFVSLSGVRRRLAEAGLGAVGLDADHPALPAQRAAWIAEAADALVAPLRAVNCLINPAAVVIGGRLPGGWIDELADALNQRLAAVRDALPALAPVRKAHLAEEAPAVGAAILPFSHFLLPSAAALWKSTGD